MGAMLTWRRNNHQCGTFPYLQCSHLSAFFILCMRDALVNCAFNGEVGGDEVSMVSWLNTTTLRSKRRFNSSGEGLRIDAFFPFWNTLDLLFVFKPVLVTRECHMYCLFSYSTSIYFPKYFPSWMFRIIKLFLRLPAPYYY